MAGRLSIFAGTGDLVPHAVAAAKAAGYKVQVLAFTPRNDLVGVKVIAADLSNPLGIIWSLKIFRTSHIAMAGAIHLPDKAREGLIRFANGNQPSGDAAPIQSVGDATLAALGKVLKKMTGADLIGVHHIAPDLLAGEGLLAGAAPERNPAADIDFALQTARAIGALDIGQAAVICGRRVIAVEDIGGTDALIARVGELAAKGLTGDGDSPLVLAKAVKPQQPDFADLPAIGPETVTNCAAADIRIIAVEAGRSLVIERERLIEAASRLGVSVYGARLGNG